MRVSPRRCIDACMCSPRHTTHRRVSHVSVYSAANGHVNICSTLARSVSLRTGESGMAERMAEMEEEEDIGDPPAREDDNDSDRDEDDRLFAWMVNDDMDEDEEEEDEEVEEVEDEQPLDTEASESFELDTPAERSGHIAVVDRNVIFHIYRNMLYPPLSRTRMLKTTDSLTCIYREMKSGRTTWSQVYVGQPRARLEQSHSYLGPGDVDMESAHNLGVKVPTAVYPDKFSFVQQSYRLNDLYYIDLDTWEWHEMSVPQQCPVGRSWHSFTPVSSDHIFLFGGFTTERETLSDAWLYCVSKNEWKPFKHGHTQSPRLWHTACSGPDGEVFVFGGCANNLLSHHRAAHSNELLVFNVQPKSLVGFCMEAILQHSERLSSYWDCLPKPILLSLKQKMARVNTLGS
ncbi:hypothetical protein F2P81_003332 [Scophthalmus maximus]|uniref:Kelch domain-containing protein 2 n=1 Tax=Scophthalmus maximus TaxID=52904 RepID=A0A6A4TLT9_SCOMX|nr:hypothetical protein F2P81_003332 [Scophthalmus maximus]